MTHVKKLEHSFLHQILTQVHTSFCTNLTCMEYSCILFGARILYKKNLCNTAWHLYK